MGWFTNKSYKQKLLEARSKLAEMEAKPTEDFDYLANVSEWRNSKDYELARQKAEIARLEVLALSENKS